MLIELLILKRNSRKHLTECQQIRSDSCKSITNKLFIYKSLSLSLSHTHTHTHTHIELISGAFLWTTFMAEQKQGDQLKPTYSSSVRIRDVALRTNQKRWTIRRSGERESGISVLAARHDIYIYIYIFGEIIGFGEFDKMIKTSELVVKSNTYNGFRSNISFFIQGKNFLRQEVFLVLQNFSNSGKW